MKQADVEIKGIPDLIQALMASHAPGDIVWFRGHADVNWDLIPGLGRYPNGIEAEMALIKRFKQNAMPFLTYRPTTEWEWLFLMQHHGVPTRLLDWTESPLIALYFAVCNLNAQDGVLWCMLPTVLNAFSNIEPSFAAEIPLFDVDEVLDNYLPFKVSVERNSKLKPAAAIASRTSARIYAQHGVFTVTHSRQEPLNSVGDESHVWRFIIPAASKADILDQLRYLRFTKLAIFPELDNVALSAREGLL